MTDIDSIAKDVGEALVPAGDPLVGVKRRWGVTTTLASGSPATVTVSVGGTTIANVRLMSNYYPAIGEVVVVDFYGSDPLIVGAMNSGATNQNAAFTVPPARIGPSPNGAYGSTYASIDHLGRAYGSAGNYMMLADTLHTFINAPSGGEVHFRVDNSERLKVTAGGVIGYGTGAVETWVADTNTFRGNYGFAMPQLANLYFRGWGDGNHRIVVPAVAPTYSTAFNVDGLCIVGFNQWTLNTGTNAHWQAVVFANGLAVFNTITAGSGATNDFAADPEALTTYGATSGISIRQRTRTWSDQVKRIVLYADNDSFHIWQDTLSLVFSIGVGASGINSASSAYIAVPVLTGGNTMNLQVGGSWQIGYISSSGKHKVNVRDLDSAISGVNNPVWKLRARRHTWNEDLVANGAETNRMHPEGVASLIAEEVAEVARDAVLYAGENPFGCPRGEGIEEGDPVGLDNDRLIAYLIDAVQYLRAEMERRRDGRAA